jgi:uncharacterized spore protein YtfJ
MRFRRRPDDRQSNEEHLIEPEPTALVTVTGGAVDEPPAIEHQPHAAGRLLESIIEGAVVTPLRRTSTKLIFGKAVTHGNRTVVPVGKIRLSFGFGGGGGSQGDGGGGGGGMLNARPVGYIEVSPDKTRFVSITDRNRLALIGLVVVGALVLLLGRRAFQ